MPRPQAQPMHVPAGLVMDQATRPELLDVGQANILNVNVRATERGALETRLGFEAGLGLTRFDGTTRTTGRRLGSHGRKPWVINGTSFEVYDAGKALWKDAGRISEVEVSTRGMAAVTSNLFDVVHCNGFLVSLGWINAADSSSDAVHAHVETVDGVLVRPSEAVLGTSFSSASQINGCLGTYGNIVIAAFTANNSSSLTMAYLDCTSATTIGSGWTLISTVSLPLKVTTGTGAYLMSRQSYTDRVAFAYINSGAVPTSRVTVFTASAAGIISQVNVNTSSVVPNSVGMAQAGASAIYVAWNETTAVKMTALVPATLATSSTTATIITTASSGGNFSPPYILETSAGAGHLIATGSATYFRAWTAAAAMAGSGSTVNLPSAYLQAAPFTRGGRFYGSFRTSQSNAFEQAILCDWTDVYTSPWIRPVANVSPGLVVNELAQAYQQPWIIDANTVAIPHMVKQSLATNRQIQLATYDFSGPDWKSAQVGDTTYIAGGILHAFDGSRLTEAGFMSPPDAPTLGLTGTGLTGTYRYVAVYETFDAAGNLVLSGVSLPATVAPANQSVTVTPFPLNITMRRNAAYDPLVQISIYRTKAGGEAPYYLVRSVPASQTTSFTDVTADSTLGNRRQLYGTGNLPGTNGAGQDRRAAPYCSDIAVYSGMLVIASGNDLWWSGQIIEGETAWFSPAFQVPVLGPGDVVALAVIDGTLYPLKEASVWAVAGEAPSDNGVTGGLGTPRRLASDVGCRNRRSVVSHGMGAFFESDRGIELLQRNGEIAWVGEQVQDTYGSFPAISSATLDERGSLCRLTVAESESGSVVSGNGRHLAYDLTLQGWISVDDVRGGSASQAAQDSALLYIDGAWRYAWLATNGQIYFERLPTDADAYLDGTNFVVPSYTMPPWKFGLAQEQRSYEFMATVERHSAAGLTVEVALNFGAFDPGLTKPWLEAVTGGERRLPFRPKALTSAIQFRVSATAPAVLGTGRGFTFIGLSADIAPKQGTTRGTPRVASSLRR
jgi:hypothetical protein